MANNKNADLNYILDGGPIEEFIRDEPTHGDVLRFYSKFWRANESDTTKEMRVTNALKSFYDQRNIQTLNELTIRHKIHNQILSLKKILKFKSKEKTQANIRLESAFKMQLSQIFQIKKSIGQSRNVDNALPMDIENENGDSDSDPADYLNDESNSLLDENLDRSQSNSNDHFQAVPNDKSFKTDDSDYSPSSPDNSDDEESCGNTKREIPEDILWAMFNTGVSFRSLSKLLELAFSLFNEKESYNFSYSYLFQKYKKLSIAKENAYKTRIQSENVFGTICFDHQKMQELSNKFASQKDRVGVVWHSEDSDRLIAVKEMPNKSGMSQALAILESCDEFNINVEQIVAVSCDNANTNVGHTSGTCSILEQRLHKPLLRLSCNHHITEIIIKDVYHHLFSTDAPNNLFYPILKEKWMQLREENFPYSPFEEDDFAENLHEFGDIIFDELKAKALASMRARLASPTIRDDYKELNILGMKFFGESFNNIRGNQVKFYALINPSNARFMGCAIQALKAFLFRDSLNWDTSERKKIKQNLQRFVIFVVLIYIPLWNSSNILFDAAINTITCLKNLEKYSQLEFQLASIAKSALSRHLIYLSEEISPLAIFSNKMSSEEKNGVAAKLTQLDSNNLPPRRIGPRQISNHIQYSEEIEFGECDQLNISQFIGERSHYLFNVMKIKTNFLQCPAELWPTDIEYLHAKNVISKTLVCVNDNSERAFSASKHRLNRQRCRNNDSYRRSMFATSYKQ